MFRASYRASPLQEKLREEHSHYPVVTELRFHRSISKSRPKRAVHIWNMQKARDPKFQDQFQRSCSKGFHSLLSTHTVEPSSDAENLDEFAQELCDVITEAADTSYGSLTILKHSRTHKLDKKISKKRAELNNFRRENWRESLNRKSEVYRQIKIMKEELKKLQSERSE